MEEKEVISLEKLVEILNEPIEIQSETLGKLEFRRIFNEDIKFIENCLKDNIDAEYFCKQFLINQITTPILTVDDLNKIDDQEIYQIVKKYVEIENFDEYFNFDNSIDIYTIFKEGMLCYRKHITSIIDSYYQSILNSVHPIIDSFTVPNNLLLELTAASESVGRIVETSNVLDVMTQNNISYINSILNGINFSGILSAANTIEILQRQITNFWKNWISVNDTINQVIKNIDVDWAKFQQEYQVSPIVAQDYLKKYHWFISPNMDYDIAYPIFEVCNSLSKHKRKEINEIFINYFLDNNCKKLDMLVNKWSVNPLFEGRIKIIKDCIYIIKNNNSKNVNYSNLIVPTLIAQIDGIRTRFMEINGLIFEDRRIYKPDGEILKDEKGDMMGKNGYFEQITQSNEFLNPMNDIFVNLLFQKAKYGKKTPLINSTDTKSYMVKTLNMVKKSI